MASSLVGFRAAGAQCNEFAPLAGRANWPSKSWLVCTSKLGVFTLRHSAPGATHRAVRPLDQRQRSPQQQAGTATCKPIRRPHNRSKVSANTNSRSAGLVCAGSRKGRQEAGLNRAQAVNCLQGGAQNRASPQAAHLPAERGERQISRMCLVVNSSERRVTKVPPRTQIRAWPREVDGAKKGGTPNGVPSAVCSAALRPLLAPPEPTWLQF